MKIPQEDMAETRHRECRMEFTERNSHCAVRQGTEKTFRKNFAAFAPLR